MGWQWYQVDHMQIIWTLLHTDNHASISCFCHTHTTSVAPLYPLQDFKVLYKHCIIIITNSDGGMVEVVTG